MVERVACTECGALILPTTAADTGGRCMTCVKGTRAGMDAMKEYREQEKLYEKEGYPALWESLVQRVYHTDAGFEGLTSDEQTYYALRRLIGDVYGGGLYSFFDGCTGNRYLLVRRKLDEHGKSHAGQLLDQAEALLFGKVGAIQAGEELLEPPLEDEDEDETEAPTPAWVLDLEILDDRFNEDQDQLRNFLDWFAREKGLLDPFRT